MLADVGLDLHSLPQGQSVMLLLHDLAFTTSHFVHLSGTDGFAKLSGSVPQTLAFLLSITEGGQLHSNSYKHWVDC